MHLGEHRLGSARVYWTDRHGGVSCGPYSTLNLGDRVGDLNEAVAENRHRVAQAVASGLRGESDAPTIVWLRQEHGARVHDVGPNAKAPLSAPVADAAVTCVPGVAVAVVTADCAPVALSCEGAAAAVHAGWRGLVEGVIGAAVTALRRVGEGPVRALIGPCIHPALYEFGAADLDRVVALLGSGVAARTGSGAPALDLPAAVRAALDLAGVGATAIEQVDVCTASSASCFSHRRDGLTGRQAMIAVLETQERRS